MIYQNPQLKTSPTMNLTSKDYPHINRAMHEGRKSKMMMKHGCVVAEGRKVLSTGYNHYRTQYGDNFINTSCSCHAEMDALRRVIRMKTKGKHSKSHKKVVLRYLKGRQAI